MRRQIGHKYSKIRMMAGSGAAAGNASIRKEQRRAGRYQHRLKRVENQYEEIFPVPSPGPGTHILLREGRTEGGEQTLKNSIYPKETKKNI